VCQQVYLTCVYRVPNVHRWTDESELVWQSWVADMPLHGAGTSLPANGTCAYLGAGDWWKSECTLLAGKLCGGRAWGNWGGGWGDVVGLAEEDAQECFGHPTTSMIPASEACYQEPWVGTQQDDPCRQRLPYICKFEPELVCAAGYYSPSGKPPCTPCAANTIAPRQNSTGCSPCITGTHTAGLIGCTWCTVTVTVEAQPARAANTTPATRMGLCQDCEFVVKSERWVSKNGVRLADAPPAVGGATWALRTGFSTCPDDVGNVSRGRGLEVYNTTTPGTNGTLVHDRREVYAYGTICCGIPGSWGSSSRALPLCKSFQAALNVLSHFPSSEYLATVDLLPGYHTSRGEISLNRSTTVVCSSCTDNSAPLHLADITVITQCLHADWDYCDKATYDSEAHACPAGYTLLDRDLNPGPSVARLCLLFSREPERISQFRLVVGPQQAASLCTEDAGEGSPLGWQQLPLDLMDGFGGDLRLRLCLLRNSVGMLTNVTLESSNMGSSKNWTTLGGGGGGGVPWIFRAMKTRNAQRLTIQGLWLLRVCGCASILLAMGLQFSMPVVCRV
jgi:hypothetical protein